ncbi:MAG TPA: hypothetical protein VNG33_09495 [Polyangiaceae bacterium]|nr:hypothetical protein [Polyangiaceae bacterium]
MDGARAFEHATLQNTLVAVWFGDPTLSEMRRFVRELQELWALHPAGIHLLNVVGERTNVPDAAVRELIRQQFESMRGRLLCMAVAMEKSGVTGTLSRAVLTTLLTMARRPFKMSIHPQRHEAANWLAQQPDVPSAARLLELTRALERGRAA